MLRNFLAIVAGYLVMAGVTGIGIFGLMIAFPAYAEAGRAQTTPPTLPMALNLVLGVGGAILGGWVTALIARNAPRRSAFILAGVVLVLGIVYAVSMSGGPQPMWYLILLPVAGAIGAAVGGMLRQPRPTV